MERPSKLDRIPKVPSEIKDAAESGMLVIFIGAGISRLAGCPLWDGFASKVLDDLTPRYLSYYEKSLIEAIPDPRKRLSIVRIIEKEEKTSANYKRILKGDGSEDNIYKHINRFNCTFVTTNYDVLIKPERVQSKSEEDWRFYERADLLNNKLDEPGNVIHLHGCVNNPEKMVIATKDYLDHYSKKEVQDFLEHLFKRKTVLFLGYGLEEFEILEYILKYSVVKDSVKGRREKRFFMLQGFFAAEESLYERLTSYYKGSFSVELIGFKKDEKDYEQQTDILESWESDISFKPLTLSDGAKFMVDELDG